MSIFKDIATFVTKTLPHALADFFSCAKTDGAKIAMAITEGIQTVLKSGLADDVAKVIEAIFPNVKNIPEDLLGKLKDLVPKVLAAELGIVGLPENATEEQIEEFVKATLAAFNVHDDKSKLYTTLAGSLYTIFRAYTGEAKLSWAEVIAEVEQAFQAFKNDQATEQTGE